MNRLKVTLLAFGVGAIVAAVCMLVEQCGARRDFLDACKQEQPIERCEAMWREGGAP